MFDQIIDSIKRGDYNESIIRMRFYVHLYEINMEKFNFEGDGALELFNLGGTKKIDKTLCKHQQNISKQLFNFLIKTYQIDNLVEKFSIDEITTKILQSSNLNIYFTNIIDRKRDEKVIKKIKEFDREMLNADGYYYDDQISEKLKTLVDEVKTKDANYISQLSDLLQAMEDDESHILLVGESGVGKSMLAKTIHSLSNRSTKGFAEVNCGEYSSEDRLNQKLFGWEKGSHNTAFEKKEGLIQEIDGGILFLDEIDRMPEGSRDAFITFVETKKFQRLGADEYTVADVHFLFGTNKDLKKLVKNDLFEGDFYNRIGNNVITIPPLRERRNDIDLIVEYCLKKYNNRYSTQIIVNPDALWLLKSYPWYGNFRVLEGYLKKIFRKCKFKREAFVTPYLINTYPPDMLSGEMTQDYKNLFQDFEKTLKEMFFHWYTSVYPKQKLEGNEEADQKNKDGFLQQLVTPILANIYENLDLNDFEMKQKIKNQKAREIIGIGGLPSGQDPSSIDKALETYKKLIEQIK